MNCKNILLLAVAIINVIAIQPAFAKNTWQPQDFERHDKKHNKKHNKTQCHKGLCSGKYIDKYQQLEIAIDNDNLDLLADSIENTGEQYLLSGNVLIAFQDIQLRGDSAVISVASKKIVMTGNVELRRPGLLIAGESIQATDSNTIVINKANILYHKAHALASGSKFTYKPNIGKRGHLHIKDAKITTCEPGDNGWEFQASSLLLNFNIDYAFMNHPRLKVEDVPVGYLPWAFFNLNQDRQWGILEPVFGSSSRGGSDITLPLYIPFNSYSDITISPQKISNRGDGLEAQFRILSKYSYSEVNTSYYENDLVYAKLKNLAENSDSKRYLLNLVHKMNLDLSEDIKFIADVNYFDVSDSHIFNDLLFATYDTGIVNGSSNIKSSAKALLQSPIGNFEYGFKRYLPTLGLLESTNYYKNYWQFAGSQNLSNSLQIDYSNHRANIVDSESNIFNRNNATVNLLHTAYTRLVDITQL